VPSEFQDEAASRRRVAGECNQKAEATNSPADKGSYKVLGAAKAESAEAYEAAPPVNVPCSG